MPTRFMRMLIKQNLETNGMGIIAFTFLATFKLLMVISRWDYWILLLLMAFDILFIYLFSKSFIEDYKKIMEEGK